VSLGFVEVQKDRKAFDVAIRAFHVGMIGGLLARYIRRA
jgi:hypothetical protein